MKRTVLFLMTILIASGSAFAQKYAYVDTEYILNNIPSYSAAQKQLDDLSQKWESEISAIYEGVEQMYRNYQNDVVLLSKEARIKREEEIINREREAKELQNSYFGVDGELFKKREELIKPLQDDIYNAIKDIAVEGAYAVIFDTSSGMNMIYTNPRYDISDEVLHKLGYKN